MLSSFKFFKSKLGNALDSHMGLVVGRHSQRQFNLVNFPYNEIFVTWMGGVDSKQN